MKRIAPWVISVGALVSLGFPTVEPAHSGTTGCSLATLKGLYMFAQSGYIISKGSAEPEGVTGEDIFHGNGKFDSLATISANGAIFVAPAPGTYTLNSDCTGKVTIPMKPATQTVHLDIYVAPDGREFFTIQTDKGTVLAGTEQRVAP